MPIDTSIYNHLQPVKLDSPLNAFAQMAQVQGVQNTNRLADLTFSEKERELGDQQKIRNVLADAGGDLDSASNALMKGGFYKQALELKKSKMEQDEKLSSITKNNAAAGKSTADTAGAVMGIYRDQVNMINDPQTAAQWAKTMFNDPRLKDILSGTAEEAIGRIPKDPAGLAKWKLEASMNAEKLQAHLLEREKLGETQRHNTSTEGIQKGQLAVSQGQLGVAQGNLGVSRERLNFEKAQPKGQYDADRGLLVDPRTGTTKPVTGPDGAPLGPKDKVPAGYRMKADGTMEVIPGGPGEKESAGTEGERNAAGYASRMSAAEKLITVAAAEDPKAQKPGIVEAVVGGAGPIANFSRSETRQKYRQAQEDWVRAKLRKESGAAIPNDEMDREINTYFPQPGDKDPVVTQKTQARKVAEQAMRQAAGKAKVAESGNGPKPGAVQDGYRFKGGNPADPNSWEKV